MWGQGDVKLQVSDVTIAVAYESREETAARKLPKNQETTAEVEEEKMEESEEENKRKRDLKQEWLREAERCQLQGRPFPTKTDIAENAAEETNNTDGQPSGAARRGRVGYLAQEYDSILCVAIYGRTSSFYPECSRRDCAGWSGNWHHFSCNGHYSEISQYYG